MWLFYLPFKSLIQLFADEVIKGRWHCGVVFNTVASQLEGPWFKSINQLPFCVEFPYSSPACVGFLPQSTDIQLGELVTLNCL